MPTLTSSLTTQTECICDDNGIEINITYEFEKSDSQIEEGHGLHDVGGGVYTQVKSVELVIAGKGIELLHQLTPKQLKNLTNKITYNE